MPARTASARPRGLLGSVKVAEVLFVAAVDETPKFTATPLSCTIAGTCGGFSYSAVELKCTL